MKSRNFIILSIMFIGLMALSANMGLCVDAVPNAAQNALAMPADIPMKTDSLGSVFGKFLITMGGVVISILLIWGGLVLYKNFASKAKSPKYKKNLLNDGLSSPKNIEEALTFFIKKNHLK